MFRILLGIIFAGCFLWSSGAYAQFIGTGYPYVFSQPLRNLPPGYTTLIVGERTFYYAQGTFFEKSMLEQAYLQVPPPIGATVYTMPQGAQMMLLDGNIYYTYNGVYYKRVLNGYRVIEPPPVLIF